MNWRKECQNVEDIQVNEGKCQVPSILKNKKHSNERSVTIRLKLKLYFRKNISVSCPDVM